MTDLLTADDVRKRLSRAVKYSGKYGAVTVAEACGVSRCFVYAVMNGQKPPSEKITKFLGLKQNQLTWKVDKAKRHA